MDSYPPPPGFSMGHLLMIMQIHNRMKVLNLKRVLIACSMRMKRRDHQLKNRKINVVHQLINFNCLLSLLYSLLFRTRVPFDFSRFLRRVKMGPFG